MRAKSSTTGAADGNIIAAVIVTQIPTYQPRPPRAVPGPMSMSRMRATSTSHVASDAAASAAATATATDLRAPGELASVAVLPGVVEGEPEVRVVVAADEAARDRQVGAHRVHRVRHLDH